MRKYDDEFKQLALSKVFDGQSVASVANELGINESSIHQWRRARLANGSAANGTSGEQEREIAELKKKLREAQLENAHPEKGGTHLRAGKLKRFIFIDSEKTNYPITMLCRVMAVSPGGYYAWRKRLTQPPTLRRRRTADLIRQSFWANKRRYGTRRISLELQKQGFRVGRSIVRRVLRVENLRAIQPKKFVPKTTDSKHGKLVSPNLLKLPENQPVSKASVIIGDITYLRLASGEWCYLAVWQDKFTRRIIGWAIAASLTAELVISALRKAISTGLIATNAIIHTERGSQDVAGEFRALPARHKFQQSMSGKGNCYDNAQAESFFSRFKAELIEDGTFSLVEEARHEIFGYIEGYYNTKRIHTGLGDKTPLEFEKELKIKERENKSSFVSTFT